MLFPELRWNDKQSRQEIATTTVKDILRMGGSTTRFAAALFVAASLAVTASADDKGGVTKKSGPPPFFLQDAQDSMCMGGEEYRRCSIDTLFFVSGSPGMFLWLELVAPNMR